MASNASISMNDYDGQTGVVGFTIPEVTAANFAAITAQLEVVEAAIVGITLGIVTQNQLSSIRRKASANSRADNPQAQRGVKWLVSYQDIEQYLDAPTNTIPNNGFNKSFDMELPTADLDLREENRNEVFVYNVGGNYASDPLVQTFVDEIQDLATSPYGGEIRVNTIRANTITGG